MEYIQKKNMKKINFSLFFIYLIAPQIWCMWMILRIGIINFNQYLQIMTSPLTIIVLISFYYINNKYIFRLKDLQFDKKEEANKHFNGILKKHLFSLTLFGSIGTFIVMLTLFCPLLTFGEGKFSSMLTVLLGSISGASLTYVFLLLFTNITINSLKKKFSDNGYKVKISSKYTVWNVFLLTFGIFFMAVSTIGSSLYLGDGNMNRLSADLLTLSIPILMGTLIFARWIFISKN